MDKTQESTIKKQGSMPTLMPFFVGFGWGVIYYLVVSLPIVLLLMLLTVLIIGPAFGGIGVFIILLYIAAGLMYVANWVLQPLMFLHFRKHRLTKLLEKYPGRTVTIAVGYFAVNLLVPGLVFGLL